MPQEERRKPSKETIRRTLQLTRTVYDRLNIRNELSKGRMPLIRAMFKNLAVDKSSKSESYPYVSRKSLPLAIQRDPKPPDNKNGTINNYKHGTTDDEKILEKYDYYHDHLSRSDAEDILLNVPVGHFLVRASRRSKQSFAIVLSIRTMKGISHYEIPTDDVGRFYFNEFSFSTVHELLLFHWKQRVPISVIGRCELYLIKSVGRQPWEFDEADIHLETTPLGEGNFGSVYRGYMSLKQQKVQLAVKTLQNPDDREGREELLHEARIMRKLDHSGVLRCYGITISSDPSMILLEFVNGGSMDKYLQKEKLTPYVKTKLITSAAHAVAHIHKMEVLHRDLAARNFLVEIVNGQPNTIKVCDFGLSKDMTKIFRLTTAQHIPVRWSAPEVLHERLWTQKSDVWSFGVVIWEIFCDASLPYFELEPLDGPTLLQSLKDGYRLIPPTAMPTDLVQLLNSMFSFHMDIRPTMSDVAARLEILLKKMKP